MRELVAGGEAAGLEAAFGKALDRLLSDEGVAAVDPDSRRLVLTVELPRFGGRFAGQSDLMRPSRLLSYSIGER